MAIQYPDFRADPNSVPNAGGWQNVISNVQKGYMLSQLPAQMKMQRALQQAQLQKAQQDVYYNPQIQESQLGLQRAQTEGETLKNKAFPELNAAQLKQLAAETGLAQANTGYAQANTQEARARTGLIGAQTSAANLELQKQRAFLSMLGGPGGGAAQGAPQPGPQPMQSPQYQPGQGQAPIANQSTQIPTQMMPQGQPQPQANPVTMPDGQVESTNALLPNQSGMRVTSPGNPSLYKVDQQFYDNPWAKELFKQYGYDQKITTSIDPNSGMAITTTTWPSGRTTVNATPLIDRAAIEQQKAIGQASGKSYEEVTKELDSTIKIQQNLDRLTNLTKDPEFLNSTGPVTSFLNGKWGQGSKEANQITADIDAWSGDIQADMMARIPGNAAKAKINFIGSFKPKSSDPPDVMAAKVDALNQSNRWLKDYDSYVAKSLREGTPYDVATQQAEKAIPFDKYTGSAKQNVARAELAVKYKQQKLPVSYVDNGQGSKMPVVMVMDKSGQRHGVPVDQYETYMRLMKGGK